MAALKFFLALLVVFVVCELGHVHAQCNISALVSTSKQTGKLVKGQPEFEANILNTCICGQSEVIVSCGLLASVEPIDDKLIKRTSNSSECLLNDGLSIFRDESVTFKYAQAKEVSFKPLSSTIACS